MSNLLLPNETKKTFCLRSDEARWRDVPACVQISTNECNVTLAAPADKQSCMLLRVRAHRRGLMSEPVEACSRFGEYPPPKKKILT